MDLGFLEDSDSAWLSNRYFPCKVGGKPAWLELDRLPENLKCARCDQPKTFLCQIYAPYGEEHSFHRSVYVFICRNASCQQPNDAANLTVLRCQLPQRNAFYSAEPPEEGDDVDPLPAIPSKRKVCVVCGCLGPYACGRCKAVNYCTASHQKVHWLLHKGACSSTERGAATTTTTCEPVAVPLPALLFPEHEIVIEESSSDSCEQSAVLDDAASEAKRLAEYRALEAAGGTGALKDVPHAELEQYASSSASTLDDKYFHRFQATVKREPQQIIRYKRAGQPLWIADPGRTIGEQLDVPNCAHCNGVRQFEFQIMPQLLLALKDDQLDWGVLAVYTCANSCQPPAGVGYVEEYIVKQDIPNDEAAVK